MNDFLATLAAQVLGLAPVIHPLIPARYAPMPPLGGVGTLDALRAGEGLAAPPLDSPLPSLDQFAAPPPLFVNSGYETVYTPFSFSQLRQAGARQTVEVEPGIEPPALAASEAATVSEEVTEVTPTEPVQRADAGRSSVVASSAPAGQRAYTATDAARPPAPVLRARPAERPLAASSPQPDMVSAPTPGDTMAQRFAPAFRSEMAAAPPPLGSEHSALTPDHAPPPHTQVAVPAFPAEPAADAASRPRPSVTRAPQAPAGSSNQLQAMHMQPAAEARAARPQPEEVALPPVASSPQLSPVAPPAKADAAKRVPPTLPAAAALPSAVNQRSPVGQNPALPVEAAQVSAFAHDERQLPALLQAPERPSRQPTQSAAVRSETAAVQPPQSAAARPEMDAVQPARGTERSAPASNPSTSSHLDGAEAAMLANPTADEEPLLPSAPASATPTPLDTGDQSRALPTQPALGAAPSVTLSPEVVAPPPARMTPQPKMAGLRSNGDATQRALSPAAAAAPAAIIQRAAIAQSRALPAVSGDSSGPVPGTTGRLSAVALYPESTASLPDQTAAARSGQAPGQPAPAAGVTPSAIAPSASRPIRLPSEMADVERIIADGLETSRGRSAGSIAGDHAIVRPVLPTGSEAAAIQGNIGRNPSQREAAPLPTIRVTIGRVEVRRSAPAVAMPANPPSRPRPALSLDDYLKRPTKVQP